MSVHWRGSPDEEERKRCNEHRRRVAQAFTDWRKRNPNRSAQDIETVKWALCLEGLVV